MGRSHSVPAPPAARTLPARSAAGGPLRGQACQTCRLAGDRNAAHLRVVVPAVIRGVSAPAYRPWPAAAGKEKSGERVAFVCSRINNAPWSAYLVSRMTGAPLPPPMITTFVLEEVASSFIALICSYC